MKGVKGKTKSREVWGCRASAKEMPKEPRSESIMVDPARMLAVYPERKVSFPFFQYYEAR